MRGFNSLTALNDVLASVGIPSITEEMVKTALAEGRPVFALDYSDHPNRDEIKAKLEEAFNGGEKAALFVDEALQDAPEAPELPEFLQSLFGSLDPENEVLEEELIPQSKLDAYIEMSCDQIALLTKQRDEARAELANEVAAHEACHKAEEVYISEARITAHMDSVSIGIYGVPHECTPTNVQVSLRRQAEQSIRKIDDYRSMYMS